MKTYQLLITGALDSGKYALLSGLSNSHPQVKTFKFTDANSTGHVLDVAYQEVQLAQSLLCVYVMSDELVAAVKDFGFLATMDAIILCVDANRENAHQDFKNQLDIICAQGMGDRLSVRMKTSLSENTLSDMIDLADEYHIAEELIEQVDSSQPDNVEDTVATLLNFHLEDIVHDVMVA